MTKNVNDASSLIDNNKTITAQYNVTGFIVIKFSFFVNSENKLIFLKFSINDCKIP